MFADRQEVVELGSGVSTVVLARLLRERGGRLRSLEHDPDWAVVVRDQLKRERLTDVATLLEAPLEPSELSLENAPWYAASAVSALPGEGIDLLLVDGPPGYGDGMAHSRYPALPALAERLAPGCLVILDDAGREAEREIVQRWAEECDGWEFGFDETTGIAVGRRGGSRFSPLQPLARRPASS